VIHVSIVNIDPKNDIDASCLLKGVNAKNVSGIILSSDNLTDKNTFEDAEKITLKEFKKAKINKGELSLTVPAKSVVTLTIQ
jgi:alpha-N-arabinofuranosidase